MEGLGHYQGRIGKGTPWWWRSAIPLWPPARISDSAAVTLSALLRAQLSGHVLFLRQAHSVWLLKGFFPDTELISLWEACCSVEFSPPPTFLMCPADPQATKIWTLEQIFPIVHSFSFFFFFYLNKYYTRLTK